MILRRTAKTKFCSPTASLQYDYVPTPFPTLNDALGGGIPPGWVVVVLGTAGSGKTAFTNGIQWELSAVMDFEKISTRTCPVGPTKQKKYPPVNVHDSSAWFDPNESFRQITAKMMRKIRISATEKKTVELVEVQTARPAAGDCLKVVANGDGYNALPFYADLVVAVQKNEFKVIKCRTEFESTVIKTQIYQTTSPTFKYLSREW